ncbi:MAG: hypothetical protein K0S65_3180 [Labilithrix sp.]|nr:hypothetical protein [Labilithrix sp.]
MVRCGSLATARRTAFYVGLAVAARAAVAHAEEPARPVRVAFTWTRAPGAERCISPAEMLTKTSGLVSRDTVLTLDRQGADFLVVGRIEPSAEGFRTELILRSANGRPLGERTFDTPGRSCRALDESLTLALVLLVETPRVRAAARGESTEELVELAPSLRTADATDPRSAPALPPSRIPLKPAQRAWTLELGLGASAVLGLLPKATVGSTLFATVKPPGFIPIVLRGTGYPFGVERVTVPGEGVAIRGFVGGAELCPLDFVHRRIELRACGGAHLAALHAEPLGPMSTTGDVVFVALPLRAEAHARFGAVDPYVAVAARWSPTSPGFVYHVVDELNDRVSFGVPLLTAELDVGVGWRVLP